MFSMMTNKEKSISQCLFDHDINESVLYLFESKHFMVPVISVLVKDTFICQID